MTAAQMYNEFEIAYEAIASADAPGYEPYEVSILLSQSQDKVVKTLIGTGIEYDDTKSLVLGPFIETVTYNAFGASAMYPDTITITVDVSPFWSVVNERLKTTTSGATVEVKPIDHSYFEANKNNPYKKPDSTKYYWRFIEKGATNADWYIYNPSAIDTYYINYLEKPDPIIVPGVTLNTIIDGTTVDAAIVADGQDCAFNTIIHRDIVELAAKLGKAYIGDPQGVQLLSEKN